MLKTHFIADTGDDLPELRLTSIQNTSQQLPELCNISESSQKMQLVLVQLANIIPWDLQLSI